MIQTLKILIRIPAFRILLAARLISNFGNGLGPIALAFGVLNLHGATASSLSIVMASQMLPLVVFMPLGGVLGDRFPRALLVGSSDVVLGALVIGNGASVLSGHATVHSMAIISFISGTLNAIWWPAFSGMVPEIVPEEYLQSANSSVAFVSNATMIVGTVTGGLIVAIAGPGWAIIIDGATFFVAGVLVFGLRHLGTTRVNDEHSPGVWADLAHGWKEFTSRSWVVAVVCGYTVIAMIMESVFAVVGPFHAKTVLGGPRPWSLILASMSLGMLVGVVVTMNRTFVHPLRIGVASQFAFALWCLVMSATHTVPLIMLAAFFAGVSMDFFMILWQTTMQSLIPRESLSRVTSYDAFGSLALAPVGLLVAGPVTAHFGSSRTLLLFSIVLAVALASVLAVPSVRNLEVSAD